MKFLTASFFVFLLIGCNNGKDAEQKNFHNFPFNTEKSSEVFPGTETFDQSQQASFSKVTKLNELMPTDSLIKLEVTDESIIGSIYDVALIKDNWFVLDMIQRKVLKFSKDGQFLQSIGRLGTGPGEYEQPGSIERCYQDNLAVYDSSKGKILVYDLNGNHLYTTTLQGDQLSIHPRSSFVWDTSDRLYLLGIPSANPKAPWHVLVNPQSHEAQFDVITGFGKRVEPYRNTNLAPWGFSSFAVVGDKIWTGSPYSNHLEVFDFEGRFVGKAGRNGSPNAPTLNDHKVKNINQVRALRREKDFNMKMCTVGPVVLSFLSRYVDVYDHHGNLLTQPLKAGKISFPLTSYTENDEHYMVTPLFILDDINEYSAKERELMPRAGFDPKNLTEENMGLRISRLNL